MKSFAMLGLLTLLVCGCDDTMSKKTSVDNTEINKRDRTGSLATPLDQGENQKDVEITANIRQQVTDSKMSVNAQNVKIVTQNGSVTLRGPVASVDEKAKIEAIARNVAGETKVQSHLDVSNL